MFCSSPHSEGTTLTRNNKQSLSNVKEKLMRVNVLMTVMVRDKIVGNSRGPVSIFCVFVFCAFEDTSSGDSDGWSFPGVRYLYLYLCI